MSVNNKGKNMSKNNSQQATTHEVRQLKDLAGLMSCVLTHKVSQTTAKFTWKGPRLNDAWPEILAFFKWTYDTTKSESQVRLFLNERTRTWRAWAFPQKANMGMSAKELTQGDEGYERAQEQRAQFSDTEGWHYWGTVHHHCSASAFQSGTDQDNERSQDGLHITVGNLDKERFDIHSRLYIGGFKLTSLKLSDFWDIGDALTSIPVYLKPLLPENAADEIARMQMGLLLPDTVFPEIWKTNVVDCTPRALVVNTTKSVERSSYFPGFDARSFRRSYIERSKQNYEMDLRKAHTDVNGWLEQRKGEAYDIDVVLHMLDTLGLHFDDDMMELMDICCRNDVLPHSFADYLQKAVAEEELERRLAEKNPKDTKLSKSEQDAIRQEWEQAMGEGFNGY